MARSTLRRQTPTLEHLESRMVLTAGGPTHEATLMLDTLSRIRMNPAEAASWVEEKADAIVQTNLSHYGIDLNKVKSQIASAAPRQPLAYDARLTSAAQGHSDDMARNNFQSHQSSNGMSLDQRLDKVGYSGRTRAAENAFAYAESLNDSPEGYVNNALEAFLIDWGVADLGHRRNILEPDDNSDHARPDEAGIGFSLVDGGMRERAVVVQNFGSRDGADPNLLGVVFEDRDGDGRLSYQEGRGGASISVRNLATDETRSVSSWDAGMYQVPLAPGRYEVSIQVDGEVLDRKPVEMKTANEKLDFNLTSLRSQGHAPAPVQVSAQALAAPEQEEAVRKAQEEARKQQEQAARQQQEQEAARKQQEQEARKSQEEAARKQQEEAARKPQETTVAVKSTKVSPPKEKQDTQMLADLLSSGLLSKPNSLNINSASTWRAR